VADPIRVLIVDDHAVVREGLRAFLELQDRMEVIGEAGDGREAIEEAERLRPDVILMAWGSKTLSCRQILRFAAGSRLRTDARVSRAFRCCRAAPFRTWAPFE
jgi:DNA-binding NarL/FixJ family response regulator